MTIKAKTINKDEKVVLKNLLIDFLEKLNNGHKFSLDNIEIDYKERYAFYWFLASKNNIISMGYGGKQPDISQDLIKSLRVTIPLKYEKLQIVEHIETQTTKVDKAIELQQNYIAKLKEYKASLIEATVIGKARVA